MTDRTLFDGRPVLSFQRERDRRNFLKWAAVIGVGGSLAVAAKDRFAAAQSGGGDVGILNYALTLEYLERDFFRRGLQEELLSGRDAELVEPILAHENEHVSILSSTIEKLGATAVEAPEPTYPSGTFGSARRWLETASMLEDLGVSAYHGQVTRIESPELLQAAASIAGVESRHAAILRELTGADPFPAPLEQPKIRAQVLKAAQLFIKS
ncbi:MAG: ferritin-like domain-containing protein [Actinomycetota bacterium]